MKAGQGEGEGEGGEGEGGGKHGVEKEGLKDLLGEFIEKEFGRLDSGLDVTQESVWILRDFIWDVYRKIMNQANDFAEIRGKNVIKVVDVEAALSIVLPFQLSSNLKEKSGA